MTWRVPNGTCGLRNSDEVSRQSPFRRHHAGDCGGSLARRAPSLMRGVLLDVLSKTTVVPPALLGKFQKIKGNDYSPQFPLRLMSKDMDLVNEAPTASGAELPRPRVA